VTGSVVEDVLSAKLVGYYNNDEGFFTNLANGNDNFGGDETYLLRGAFNLTAAPNVDFLLRLETGSTEGDGPINQNRGFASGHDVNLDNEGFTDISWTSASLENNWDVGIGDGVITNILSWKETDNINNSDIDAGPNNVFNFALNVDQVQYSVESRYTGSFFNDRWTTTLGGYFFTQDIQYREFRELFGGALSSTFGGQQNQNTYGLFSSNDFAVTDAVTLTLGGRYTFEEKDVSVARQNFGSPPCTFDTSETCQFDFVDSEDWSNFSPKVGLQWDINDDSQVYGTWSRGFRSGGYNLRLTGPLDPGPTDEESQSAFEIGFKGDLFDDRLRTNIAVFSSDIDDVQRQITETLIIGGNPTVVQTVENTADITIQGIEVEATAIVSDSLAISGFLGVLDGEYDEVLGDLNADGAIDDLDLALDFPLLAELSYGVSLDYTHQLPSGEVGLLASYSFRDDVASDDANTPTTRQPSINNVDASLRYTSEDERWTFSIYGQNLTDEVFLQTVNVLGAITAGPNGGDGSIQTPAKGRVIGAEMTVNF